ncbi:hypothetical protein DY000_02048934 [Brassica cretica]|uniref:Uncharacterized protein n=1 Tax=Brassica cretica TaxID=69181 RepID=A0ABQ7ETF2_BRACR|nr:hypothetical protein DY000_02048934 [Brassica cretica]
MRRSSKLTIEQVRGRHLEFTIDRCTLCAVDRQRSACMTSRHTRRNAQGGLVTFSNHELARLERTNRQQPRQTDTTMGANQDDLTAVMALMQQQMLQMQQTIQAQQDAAEQASLAR